MKRVLFYGDSNTYGYDPADYIEGRYPASVRWVERLRKELAGEWQIYDDGLNGRCIPTQEYALANLRRSIREASPLDVICIMLGTNDYVQMMQPDPEAVARKMEKLIGWIRSLPAEFEIIILSPPMMDFRGDPYMYPYDTRDGKLSDAYRHMAERCQVIFYNTDEWHLSMAYDRGHLSEEGHRQMAEHLSIILRDLL